MLGERKPCDQCGSKIVTQYYHHPGLCARCAKKRNTIASRATRSAEGRRNTGKANDEQTERSW
jgi:hypothetical protein